MDERKSRMANLDLQNKISECSQLIRLIETLEFKLIEHGLHGERRLTRIIKRHLIFRQTEYWTELEKPLNHEPKKKLRKKK